MDVHWRNSICGCLSTLNTSVCGNANTAAASQAVQIMILPRFLVYVFLSAAIG